jgi:hypothetical protein
LTKEHLLLAIGRRVRNINFTELFGVSFSVCHVATLDGDLSKRDNGPARKTKKKEENKQTKKNLLIRSQKHQRDNLSEPINPFSSTIVNKSEFCAQVAVFGYLLTITSTPSCFPACRKGARSWDGGGRPGSLWTCLPTIAAARRGDLFPTFRPPTNSSSP